MDNCRVSEDELEHDTQQERLKTQREAISDVLADKVDERYQTLIDDPQWLWEALGPDGFIAPNGNSAFLAALDDIFITSVINHEWDTAAAIVMTRAVLDEIDDILRIAVNAKHLSRVASILEERCTEKVRQTGEHVNANWSDYE